MVQYSDNMQIQVNFQGVVGRNLHLESDRWQCVLNRLLQPEYQLIHVICKISNLALAVKASGSLVRFSLLSACLRNW